MIPAPAAVVVLDDRAADAARDRAPGDAVAWTKAHDQIGCLRHVGPGVHLFRVVDFSHRVDPFLLVVQPFQPFRDLTLDPLGFLTRLDRPVRFPAGHVQVDPAEPHGVGLRPRPVDVLKHVCPGERALHSQEPVLMQPAVQVDAAPKWLEAMIGHHDEHRVVAQLAHGPSDEVVHLQVQLLDGLGVLGDVSPAVRWMRAVEMAEEHVLEAVGDVEHAHHRAARRLLERVEEHARALLVNQVGLREKGVLVDDLFVQR